MTLAEAIKTVIGIVNGAIASDSFYQYILTHVDSLIEATKVIIAFGMDLLKGDKLMSPEESVDGAELYALLQEVDGSTETKVELTPVMWIMIAVQIAKLIWQARHAT